MSGLYAHFDDMTWPAPGEELSEVEWHLRYGGVTRSDLVVAASVIAAYRELISAPRRKRERVIRGIRAAVVPR